MTLYVTSDRPGHDSKPQAIDLGIKLIEIPGRSTATVVTDFRESVAKPATDRATTPAASIGHARRIQGVRARK